MKYTTKRKWLLLHELNFEWAKGQFYILGTKGTILLKHKMGSFKYTHLQTKIGHNLVLCKKKPCSFIVKHFE